MIDDRQRALAALPSIAGQSWRLQAVCADHWPEAWFPGDKSNDPRRWDYARAVCVTCPVRSECLAFALDTEESFGMFGGMTPDERKALKQREAS